MLKRWNLIVLRKPKTQKAHSIFDASYMSQKSGTKFLFITVFITSPFNNTH